MKVHVLMFPKALKKIDKDTLQIEWDDGHVSIFNIVYLRDHCPCAYCKESRRKQSIAKPKVLLSTVQQAFGQGQSPTLLEAHVVGKYAIKFIWSDGHEDGIYPFTLLRELCQCDACLARKQATK
ncbi:MAG: DUF971 domain-containing protein [candidate division KSB1 bacterium]|nr:DUF971 domain-containing protein [candidate division KSB1 bacterium]